MCIEDQPEECMMMCMKRRDLNMGCSHCTLLSSLPNNTQSQSLSATSSMESSSHDGAPLKHRTLHSRWFKPNKSAQISTLLTD